MSLVTTELVTEGADAALPHARSLLEGKSPLRMLVLGDSVAAGVAASSYRRAFPWLWANHLRQKHGSPIHLANLSRAGVTSAFGVEAAGPAAHDLRPDLAVVAFGLNDQRPRQRGRRPSSWRRPVAVPVDEFRTNIMRIADHIRRRSGADVVLVTPCPLPGLEQNDEYCAAIAEISERTEFVLADVAAAWPTDVVGLLEDDGLHPNDAGHRVYAETLCGLGL